MTRLRQKYKKLKQAFDRRPTKVIRQMSEPHTSVVYRHFLPDQDAGLHIDFDFESRVREYAAKAIAEQIIKDGLITVHIDGVFGGTEYRYEVMVVPPFETSLERWIEEDLRSAYMREGGQDDACKH